MPFKVTPDMLALLETPAKKTGSSVDSDIDAQQELVRSGDLKYLGFGNYEPTWQGRFNNIPIVKATKQLSAVMRRDKITQPDADELVYGPDPFANNSKVGGPLSIAIPIALTAVGAGAGMLYSPVNRYIAGKAYDSVHHPEIPNPDFSPGYCGTPEYPEGGLTVMDKRETTEERIVREHNTQIEKQLALLEQNLPSKFYDMHTPYMEDAQTEATFKEMERLKGLMLPTPKSAFMDAAGKEALLQVQAQIRLLTPHTLLAAQTEKTIEKVFSFATATGEMVERAVGPANPNIGYFARTLSEIMMFSTATKFVKGTAKASARIAKVVAQETGWSKTKQAAGEATVEEMNYSGIRDAAKSKFETLKTDLRNTKIAITDFIVDAFQKNKPVDYKFLDFLDRALAEQKKKVVDMKDDFYVRNQKEIDSFFKEKELSLEETRRRLNQEEINKAFPEEVVAPKEIDITERIKTGERLTQEALDKQFPVTEYIESGVPKGETKTSSSDKQLTLADAEKYPEVRQRRNQRIIEETFRQETNQPHVESQEPNKVASFQNENKPPVVEEVKAPELKNVHRSKFANMTEEEFIQNPSTLKIDSENLLKEVDPVASKQVNNFLDSFREGRIGVPLSINDIIISKGSRVPIRELLNEITKRVLNGEIELDNSNSSWSNMSSVERKYSVVKDNRVYGKIRFIEKPKTDTLAKPAKVLDELQKSQPDAVRVPQDVTTETLARQEVNRMSDPEFQQVFGARAQTILERMPEVRDVLETIDRAKTLDDLPKVFDEIRVGWEVADDIMQDLSHSILKEDFVSLIDEKINEGRSLKSVTDFIQNKIEPFRLQAIEYLDVETRKIVSLMEQKLTGGSRFDVSLNELRRLEDVIKNGKSASERTQARKSRDAVRDKLVADGMSRSDITKSLQLPAEEGKAHITGAELLECGVHQTKLIRGLVSELDTPPKFFDIYETFFNQYVKENPALQKQLKALLDTDYLKDNVTDVYHGRLLQRDLESSNFSEVLKEELIAKVIENPDTFNKNYLSEKAEAAIQQTLRDLQKTEGMTESRIGDEFIDEYSFDSNLHVRVTKLQESILADLREGKERPAKSPISRAVWEELRKTPEADRAVMTYNALMDAMEYMPELHLRRTNEFGELFDKDGFLLNETKFRENATPIEKAFAAAKTEGKAIIDDLFKEMVIFPGRDAIQTLKDFLKDTKKILETDPNRMNFFGHIDQAVAIAKRAAEEGLSVFKFILKKNFQEGSPYTEKELRRNARIIEKTVKDYEAIPKQRTTFNPEDLAPEDAAIYNTGEIQAYAKLLDIRQKIKAISHLRKKNFAPEVWEAIQKERASYVKEWKSYKRTVGEKPPIALTFRELIDTVAAVADYNPRWLEDLAGTEETLFGKTAKAADTFSEYLVPKIFQYEQIFGRFGTRIWRGLIEAEQSARKFSEVATDQLYSELRRNKLNTKSRERVGVYLRSLENGGIEALKREGIKVVKEADLTPGELRFATNVREWFESIFGEVEQVHDKFYARQGRKLIKREHYFPVLGDIARLYSQDASVWMQTAEQLGLLRSNMRRVPLASWMKTATKIKRVGALDAMDVVFSYAEALGKYKYTFPLVERVLDLINRKHDLSKLAEHAEGKMLLERLIKEGKVEPDKKGRHYWSMREQAPNQYKAIQEAVIQGYSGKLKNFDSNNPLHRVGFHLANNVAVSTLSLAASSVLNQAGSIPSIIAGTSVESTLIGIYKAMADTHKGEVYKRARSFDKASTSYDANVKDFYTTKTHSTGALKTVMKATLLPLQMADTAVRKIAYFAAEHQALQKGMSPYDAGVYADAFVAKSQSNASYFNRPSIQADWAGKIFTPLQSFNINQWSYLLREIAGRGIDDASAVEITNKIGKMAFYNGALALVYNKAFNMNSPNPSPLTVAWDTWDSSKENYGETTWKTLAELVSYVPFVQNMKFAKSNPAAILGPAVGETANAFKFIQNLPVFNEKRWKALLNRGLSPREAYMVIGLSQDASSFMKLTGLVPGAKQIPASLRRYFKDAGIREIMTGQDYEENLKFEKQDGRVKRKDMRKRLF